jgi:multiple sugar transport system ATP-binding protein
MRAEIAGLQRELGITTMYVTHDQFEAMTMGTRIAVIRAGRLQQCGAPQTVYDEPDNIFVATFIGSPKMNVLQGRIERDGRALHCVLGDQRLPIAGTNGLGTALDAYAGADVAVGVRPEHLGDPAEGPPDRPRLRGQVRFVELLGAERMVQIQLDAKPVVVDQVLEIARDVDAAAAEEILGQARSEQALVTARFDAHARVSPGDLVEVAVRTERLHFFDLTTGRAIR